MIILYGMEYTIIRDYLPLYAALHLGSLTASMYDILCFLAYALQWTIQGFMVYITPGFYLHTVVDNTRLHIDFEYNVESAGEKDRLRTCGRDQQVQLEEVICSHG